MDYRTQVDNRNERHRGAEGIPTSEKADPAIKHASDTALWVATFRAQEAQRTNAAFADPLASMLAGARGRAMARDIPRAGMVEWGMVVRTSAIDRLINEAFSADVDTVLNLGAGLDTRPYRMKLPATLRWVELDFPHLVELKNSKLVDYEPVFQLERVGIDLLDRPARQEIFDRYARTSKSTLVVTEGFPGLFFHLRSLTPRMRVECYIDDSFLDSGFRQCRSWQVTARMGKQAQGSAIFI